MKKLYVNISVDDIRPGFPTEEQMSMMKQLHERFGIKFTWFVTPYWIKVLKVTDYLEHVQRWKHPFVEIAAHGLYHMAHRPEDHIEFENLDPATAEKRIVESLDLFEAAGLGRPTGWKFPGWKFNSALVPVIDKHFQYVSAHDRYPKSFKIKKFLYPVGIHEGGREHIRANKLLLTSHLDEPQDNTWRPALLERLTGLFSDLQKDYELVGSFLKDLPGDDSVHLDGGFSITQQYFDRIKAICPPGDMPILEFGAGISTKAFLAEGYDLVSIEHDEKYVGNEPLGNYFHAPLQDFDPLPGAVTINQISMVPVVNRWYNKDMVLEAVNARPEYAFWFIDGPPESISNRRRVLELIKDPSIKKPKLFLVDDVHRGDGQDVVRGILEQYPDATVETILSDRAINRHDGAIIWIP